MTTRKICLTAMGTALFVVLSLCLQVPVFENYYLCLGYVVMMVFCYYFGPFSSVIVSTLGGIVIATAVAILGIKSLVEMILYAQPFFFRVAKNVYAFIADIVVMAVSIPVCEKLETIINKLFPDEITTIRKQSYGTP